MAADPAPYRLVDGDGRAWLIASRPGDQPAYSTGYGRHQHTLLTEVLAGPAPVRPVEQVDALDVEVLRQQLARAGRRAVPTLATAVRRTLLALVERAVERGAALARDPLLPWLGSYSVEGVELGVQQLVAGRPGSWESIRLIDMAMWAADIAPERVDDAVCEQLVAVLWRWTTGPERYVEVAETLAEVVSGLADDVGELALVDAAFVADPMFNEYGPGYLFGLMTRG